jgi:hypothetical protein
MNLGYDEQSGDMLVQDMPSFFHSFGYREAKLTQNGKKEI